MSLAISATNEPGQLQLNQATKNETEMKAREWLLALAIALITLVIRLPELGNPAPDFDEQLYFLAGDRMWQGDLPFVDIWDRKPIGLFLIYAAIRLLGGDGIIQYQLVAVAFAAASAWIIFLIASRFAGWKGSLSAALIYVLYLRGLNSFAGQTETFLMLFCVGAMLLSVKAMETENLVRIKSYAFATMLVMGLALQVKYTVLPQCVFFGLFFLWRIRSFNGYPTTLVKFAPLFVTIGLLPTFAVAAYYYFIGHFQDFYYANFTSIFDRGPLTGDIQKYCITYSTLVLFPLIIIGLASWLERKKDAHTAVVFSMIAYWGLACFFAIIMTGSIYIHYTIPIVPALAILTGKFIDKAPIRLSALVALAIHVSYMTDYPAAFKKNQIDTVSMQHMTDIMKPHLKEGCIYVYDGPSALYTTTGSCLPTRRPYPDHLNNLQEKHSMGLNQAEEVKRILATKPIAITIANRPVVPQLSKEPLLLVKAALATDYHLVTRKPYDRRLISVYLRNDLLPPARTR